MLCACGSRAIAAGLCRPCYRRAAHSTVRFGGHRTQVLLRDDQSCRICRSTRSLIVHHRRPGTNRPAWLVTLCAACHARIHRLAALEVWMPRPFRRLWREQHPRAPYQLQLPFREQA